MNDSKFNRGAWLTLFLALSLLVLVIGQLAYRFTLPTDGWFLVTAGVDDADWKYVDNLVGVPSGLHSGDVLVQVEDQVVAGIATNKGLAPPAQWQVGNTVTVQVQRGDNRITVPVPVVHWTVEAFWRAQFSDLVPGIGLFSLIFLLGIAWFTFLRRPEVLAARALLIFATGTACASISSLLPDGLSVMFNPLAFVATTYFSYAIYATVIGPSLLAFALFFPAPKRFFQAHPRWVWFPVILGFILTVLLLFFLSDIIPVKPSVLWFSALACIIGSIAALIHSAFTTRDPIGRAQLRWAGSGLALGLVLFILNFPAAFGWVPETIGVWFLALSRLSSPIIGLGLAIAILRYRLFDIDIIIRRTLTYALVTALLVLVFFGCVIALQQLFSVFADSGQNEWVTVLSTLAIAALFVPLRNRIQTMIDRRFNRNKYDVQQVLQTFGETVRDETDLEQLTAQLMQVVDETMQPKSVSLWLKQEKESARR